MTADITSTAHDLGTQRAKATAALVLASMARKPRTELVDELKRIERATMVSNGLLNSSPTLPFPVALPVSLTGATIATETSDLPSALRSAIADTVNGRHELWFTLDGHAMMSMEFRDDAVLFALRVGAGSG
ncbi:hypothetical protein C8J25_103354 [Sphingomonas faeni]|uniref:Uncharacterized protein n=1 Tax=Sphingomonas faeni TaxID=185950 RepID=A0A2T5U7Z0_9SPHN|nr:hypothetical protein [Sphingomonas faeni]PTW47633.1 hypothetical protein C8J25_103354 [Sphingomonas faeni]